MECVTITCFVYAIFNSIFHSRVQINQTIFKLLSQTCLSQTKFSSPFSSDKQWMTSRKAMEDVQVIIADRAAALIASSVGLFEVTYLTSTGVLPVQVGVFIQARIQCWAAAR